MRWPESACADPSDRGLKVFERVSNNSDWRTGLVKYAAIPNPRARAESPDWFPR